MKNDVPTEILIESLVASIEKHKREIEELKNERNEYRSKLLAALTGTQILDEACPDFESAVEEDIDVSEERTVNLLRAKLVEKGVSFTAWGRAHGYKNGVVWKTLSRYVMSKKRPSIGSISLAIIEALEAETGIKICG